MINKLENYFPSHLEVWQISHSLVLDVYAFSEHFPYTERFGMTSQLRRAAASIAANITEGYGRNTTKGKIQFYNIAASSNLEVRYFLLLAKDLEYISEETYKNLLQKTISIGKMLSTLQRVLRRKEIAF